MPPKTKIYSSKDEIETEKLRCWLEINLSNLKNNIETIRSILPENTDIMAVVKANCYGLGAVHISKYLSSIGIKYFAVSTLDEALELRNLGEIKEEILILGWTPVTEKETLIKHNLTQTLVSFEYAKKLSELPGVLKCHVKINTGMNRFGENIAKIENIKAMYSLKNLDMVGIYSHLCRVSEYGEEPENFTKKQIDEFNTIIEQLEKDGIKVGVKHLMNSFGTLKLRGKKYDLVRPGVIMYGFSPEPDNEKMNKLLEGYNLKPVPSLKSKVMTVKTIEKGEKVGYCGNFTAEEKMKIATISIGYADGLFFANSKNGFRFIIKGHKCPLIGNICMDNSFVKLPLDCDIEEGDIATLFGFLDDGDKFMNIKEFLTKSGSPFGETFTHLGERITRIFHY